MKSYLIAFNFFSGLMPAVNKMFFFQLQVKIVLIVCLKLFVIAKNK